MVNAPPSTQLPRGKTLDHGTPVGPNNPADGIMAMRVLVQTDPSTGRWATLLTVGADPADTDGLVHFGWSRRVDPTPRRRISASRSSARTSASGRCWPAPPVDAVRNAAEGREGASSTPRCRRRPRVPGVVAALPWFAVERVILFGGEYLHSRAAATASPATLLADIEVDWSIDLLGLSRSSASSR